ncbi:MAG: outer membrane beta-barrel protein [Crocinitomicaceae bacterium]
MKRVLGFIGAVLIATIGFNNTAQAQVEEGNIIIDPYYGYPNFGKSFFDLFVSDNNVAGVSINALGPAGLRAEYMLADNFGLGVDFIYNSVSGSGTVDSLAADGVTVVETYDAKLYSRRYRIHLRANYHFVQTGSLDAYVGFGAGTNIRQFGVTSDYPNFNDDSISGSLIPVSARVALGARYYFTDNIGFNTELGLGGPLLSLGLSLKF